MKIHSVEILAGRKHLKRAMAATRGKILSGKCRPLSDDNTRKAILQRHGTLDRYIFYVVATVPDRVHDHLRVHSLVNDAYACSSSRPDLEHSTSAEMRVVDFNLPLKRAMEIFEKRLCGESWYETVGFFELVRDELYILEPALVGLLQPKCFYKGYCDAENKCKNCAIEGNKFLKSQINKYIKQGVK